MSSLLIIGGSGFFGKSILDAYRRGILSPWKLDRIEVVARNATHLLISNPELISERIFLHDLDITSCTYLPEAKYVIHAAASTDAKNYLARPEVEKQNIQLGSANFCKLAQRYLSGSKILYASSGAAYGQQAESTIGLDESVELREISTLDPGKRDYAAAKRDGECYIQELGGKGLNVSIARCFAFLGPYLPRDQHFAIGNFIQDGLQGKPIEVKARHPVYRSYLYADDLATWLMTILEHSNPGCPVVNVGSDEAILMGELAKRVADYFGVSANIPAFSNSMVDRYAPSIDRALAMGCNKPLNLNDALRATIDALKLYNF